METAPEGASPPDRRASNPNRLHHFKFTETTLTGRSEQAAMVHACLEPFDPSEGTQMSDNFNPTTDDFAAMFESSTAASAMQEGQVIPATVIRIDTPPPPARALTFTRPVCGTSEMESGRQYSSKSSSCTCRNQTDTISYVCQWGLRVQVCEQPRFNCQKLQVCAVETAGNVPRRRRQRRLEVIVRGPPPARAGRPQRPCISAGR